MQISLKQDLLQSFDHRKSEDVVIGNVTYKNPNSMVIEGNVTYLPTGINSINVNKSDASTQTASQRGSRAGNFKKPMLSNANIATISNFLHNPALQKLRHEATNRNNILIREACFFTKE